MPKSRRIHDMPSLDRPREKLQRKGSAALSDFELLEVMIGSGNAKADVGSIARQVQRVLRKGVGGLTLEALLQVYGVNTVQACRLLASFELAKRHLVRDVQPLCTQEDIVARLDDIRSKQQEHFVALSIDGGQRLIALRIYPNI